MIDAGDVIFGMALVVILAIAGQIIHGAYTVAREYRRRELIRRYKND